MQDGVFNADCVLVAIDRGASKRLNLDGRSPSIDANPIAVDLLFSDVSISFAFY